MLTTVFTSAFVITILVLAFFLKKVLYIDEHEADILNELNAFDKNINEINDITNIPEYKLGSGHMYSK